MSGTSLQRVLELKAPTRMTHLKKSIPLSFIPAEIIKKKRKGLGLSSDEMTDFFQAYLKGQVQEEQMSALLMAIFFQGLSDSEIQTLTQLYLQSGQVFRWQVSNLPVVDKHSTGGVGDKTSLVLAPLVASLGVAVPMISGRSLGHTGGTLDKLECIPGFNSQLSPDEARRQLLDIGCFMIGQTEEVCPLDKKIYALRDTTGTVESIPLVCASIMSKKLAEGLSGLVLDVKFGSGAFFKNFPEAKALAEKLVAIGSGAGVQTKALLTSMEQPLGEWAGHASEIQECLDILKNQHSPMMEDTRHLSLELAAWMLVQSGRWTTIEQARKDCDEALISGKAYTKFESIVGRQGGSLEAFSKKYSSQNLEGFDICADQSGFFVFKDVEALGWALLELGGGRKTQADPIDPRVSLQFLKKTGDRVESGETCLRYYCSADLAKNIDHKNISARIKSAFEVLTVPMKNNFSLIAEILG